MQYRLKLDMNISNDPDNPEWTTVTGRIFDTDKPEEDIDAGIRELESRLSK